MLAVALTVEESPLRAVDRETRSNSLPCSDENGLHRQPSDVDDSTGKRRRPVEAPIRRYGDSAENHSVSKVVLTLSCGTRTY